MSTEIRLEANTRVLARIRTSRMQRVLEFQVIEVSPDGKWAKLRGLSGREFWNATADITVEVVLPEVADDQRLVTTA